MHSLLSVHQFSCSVMSNSLWPMDCSMPRFPVHHQPPEIAQTHIHRVGDAIQPSHPLFLPFSSCLQSFPALWSFPISQIFASGGQSIGVSASASVLPMNIQDWFPLGLSGLISLQSKGTLRVFSNTTVQKPVVDSCWYVAKPIQYCKVKKKLKKKEKKKKKITIQKKKELDREEQTGSK